MKSFLIIGMGRFGSHLCRNLAELGNEIMIVDEKEELLEPLLPYVTSAKIGDCTKEEVLKSLGVGNFDKCFVCIGTNFQSSLEITCLLKELGAKYVISKATRDVHAKFLLRNGADEIVYPDRDIAEKCAVQYSSDSVYDYFEVTDDFSIYEIAPLPSWIGKTIIELDIRNRYHTNIVAIQDGENIQPMPPANYRFKENEHLMVIGRNEDIQKLIRKYDN
ncbi:MAG: TrkA family potassium uptake protein [Eubacterium sp.]